MGSIETRSLARSKGVIIERSWFETLLGIMWQFSALTVTQHFLSWFENISNSVRVSWQFSVLTVTQNFLSWFEYTVKVRGEFSALTVTQDFLSWFENTVRVRWVLSGLAVTQTLDKTARKD